jgi:hypothetical protein
VGVGESKAVNAAGQRSVYVWQRAWTPAVSAAVREAQGRFDLICWLAAERQAFSGGRAGEWRWVKPDGSVLVASGAALAAAVRMDVRRQPLEQEAAELLRVRDRLLSEARAQGLRLAEIHLDVDCPRSRLGEYAGLMRSLRQRPSDQAEGTWVITALPDWLEDGAFAGLVQAAGQYVLQVHALALPGPGTSESLMCEAGRSKAWVQRAADVGVPFRVALPTYASRVFYDAAGKVLDVAGEDGSAEGPAGTVRSCLVRTDAGAVAGLVADWGREAPAGCRGVIWYRLPVAGDRWNWSGAALAEVMAGRAPVAAVQLETHRNEAGFYEVTARNRGGVEARIPRQWIVTGPGGAVPVAWDFHGNWKGQMREGKLIISNPGGWLFPAQAPRLGWVRLDRPGVPVLTPLP